MPEAGWARVTIGLRDAEWEGKLERLREPHLPLPAPSVQCKTVALSSVAKAPCLLDHL